MNVRILLPALLTLALAGTACQPPAQEQLSSMEDDIAYLRTIPDQFDAALAAGDAAGLAALYADDAVRMMPDMPAWVGNEAIQAGFGRTLTENAERWSSMEVDNIAQDVIVSGDWASVRGTYTGTFTPAGGGEPISESGKWMSVLKRQSDGTWKVVWDIWNRDAPVPEASM